MKKSSSLKPIFCGVIHLQPLPGSFQSSRLYRDKGVSYPDQISLILKRALREASFLEKAGFDSLIIENFGDVPFLKESVAAETLGALAIITREIRDQVRVPVGVNVLRNDALSALSIASVTGCEFIRVNVLSGVAATDQGWLEGRAAEVLALRERLNPEIKILADVWVKHARHYSSDSLTQAIEETFFRAGADGVIVTGSTTGRLPSESSLEESISCCKSLKIPLFIGSGVSADRLEQIPRTGVSGILVGSDLRQNGKAGAPLDHRRAAHWIRRARNHFSSG